jgi:hypothetical protein
MGGFGSGAWRDILNRKVSVEFLIVLCSAGRRSSLLKTCRAGLSPRRYYWPVHL